MDITLHERNLLETSLVRLAEKSWLKVLFADLL
jgi:hypothetical protein